MAAFRARIYAGEEVLRGGRGRIVNEKGGFASRSAAWEWVFEEERGGSGTARAYVFPDLEDGEKSFIMAE